MEKVEHLKAENFSNEKEDIFREYREKNKIRIVRGENVGLYIDFESVPFGSDTLKQQLSKMFEKPTAI